MPECVCVPGVNVTSSLNLLGVTLTSDLKWDSHISNMLKKCNQRLFALRILRRICNDEQLRVYICV